MVVADERAGQEVRFAEHLKAVADAEDGHAFPSLFDDFPHDGRCRGDCTTAQVVAVGESPRDDDRVDAMQFAVLVPQGNGLAASEAHCARRILVVEGAGEGDDSNAGHLASSSGRASTRTTSSMIGFERTSSAAVRA